MSDFNLPKAEWIDERVPYEQEDWDRDMAYFRSRGLPASSLMQQEPSGNMEYAMNAYLQPAIEQVDQKRMMYNHWLTSVVMGIPATREVIPGVWEHTFTPASMDMRNVAGFLGRLHEPGWIPEPWAWIDKRLAKHRREERAHKRTRRQHRAAFRRRKRGLA